MSEKISWVKNAIPKSDCATPMARHIAKPEKHTELFNPEIESGNMIIQDGVIIGSHCALAEEPSGGMGEMWEADAVG